MPNNENNEYLHQVQSDKIYDIHDARIKIGSLLPEEVERILNNMGMSRIDLSKDLVEGKKVKIISGPFKDMIGKISSYDLEKKKVNLLLDLFGQETPVEAELNQIENI